MRTDLGVAGAVIVGIAAVYYVVDVLRGRSKPQRTSWGVWSVIGLLGFGTASTSGAGPGAYTSAVYVIAYVVTFLISLAPKYGKPGGRGYDIALGVIAVMVMVFWRFGTLPTASAAAVAVVADGLGLWPTLREAWLQPEHESLLVWTGDVIGNGLCVMALGSGSFGAAAYPVYLLCAPTSVVAALLWRRRDRRRREQVARRVA